MCGIGVIISGVRIGSSSPISHSTSPVSSAFSVDDLKTALGRRGPDNLGCKKVFLHPTVSGEECVELRYCGDKCDCTFFANGELHFIGATLQLRGVNPITQPLVDESGNILVYNGEIFGGIHVGSDSNDAEILMQSLGKCCTCGSHGHTTACNYSGLGKSSIPELLSTIKGPWAIIYWQDSSRTMWFGRDAFGRRSLLVHWPNLEDCRFLLSSVSPISSVEQSSDFEVENGITNINFWDELSCGVYSVSIGSSKADKCLLGEVKKHEWTNPILKELVKWERTYVEPKPAELHFMIPSKQPDVHSICLERKPSGLGPMQTSVPLPAQTVLIALRESMMRRTTQSAIFPAVTCDLQQEELVPVAILFSGGLDSMILAALLDECLQPSYGIDLLNVSFDGQSAPDRISAKAGLKELQRISPLRRWKLVEVDADLSKLTQETKHVMSLINPAKTYMDLNIGIALWLAAGGDGWVHEEIGEIDNDNYQRVKYKSKARILLVGSGADEQCAGYGRHKTKYRSGSWLGLNEEMKLDMQRIWKRNLGRDDRCIADNGKEARFPFLDEDVIRTLLDIPLWEVANLDQPSGTGDKKILREVAQMLGIYEAATLPKRAIQFGSRIARESNRKNFGSNRAANQASAGSVVIYGTSNLT